MDAQIVEKDMQGILHAVVDTLEGKYATFNIAACGSLFSKDQGEPKYYDPASTEAICKKCNKYAHAKWCDGLTAAEIRERELKKEQT